MAEQLLPHLKGLDAQIVLDPAPADPVKNAWRTYRACLESLPQEATHLLIVQDDATVCGNFAAALPHIIAAQRERIICLFVGGAPARSARRLCLAGDAGRTFAELDPADWLPCVATIYPAVVAADILAFVDSRAWQRTHRGDDHRLGEYVRARRLRALATVPSLVQHPDNVPSIIGTVALAGANPARVACCYIGNHDPLLISW